jgi:sulfur carrier protein
VQILVNGREQETKSSQTVEELLKELGYGQNSVAVALDGEFLPRRLYSVTKLEERMDLEILLPMQGG